MIERSTNVLVATKNKGKLRDFEEIARPFGVNVFPVENFDRIEAPEETGSTFTDNARLKADYYSHFASGEIVIADDSGLEVSVLDGAPGVQSARYASTGAGNASDFANNSKLIHELFGRPHADRSARYICVIAAARDGVTLATFEGEVCGEILQMPVGKHGFGYDPLFYYPPLNKTFGELSDDEKAEVSHRGVAFRKFLEWMKSH
jgi:XTP/dITP diphosphohydrolase